MIKSEQSYEVTATMTLSFEVIMGVHIKVQKHLVLHGQCN